MSRTAKRILGIVSGKALKRRNNGLNYYFLYKSSLILLLSRSPVAMLFLMRIRSEVSVSTLSVRSPVPSWTKAVVKT